MHFILLGLEIEGRIKPLVHKQRITAMGMGEA